MEGEREEIICQGDSLLDLIEPQDHPLVVNNISLYIKQPQDQQEKVFCCRMNIFRNGKSTSRFYCHNKLMLMTVRLILPEAKVLESQEQQESGPPFFVAAV
uniref:Uncharacterized protein n=1 Tax=Ditylenchus dipsaci TaxID=166011 RepID=A0A915DKX8_9BILA